MPVYDLVNPSDPYTMRAKNHQTAVVALLFLSYWRIGGKPIDNPESEGRRTTLYPLGLTEEAMEKELAEQGIPEGLDVWLGSRENVQDLAQALDSVLYGDMGDRNLFEAASEAISDPARVAELKAKHQDRRTSMNNIGARAAKLAEQFRDKAEELATVVPPKDEPKTCPGCGAEIPDDPPCCGECPTIDEYGPLD